MSLRLDDHVVGILKAVSPTLVDLATTHDQALTNAAFDAELDALDADEVALQKIEDDEFLNRVLDDFDAYGVPIIDAVAPPLETWAIPVLASFATPAFAPFVSGGLLVACKVGVLALDKWKAVRDARKAQP